MDYKDYYQVLGIDRKAKEEEIKRVYRKLAMKHHPDHNPGDKQAEERFKEINEAYQVLGDAEKRAHYDRLGSAYHDFQRQGGRQGGFNWGDWSARGAGGATRVEVDDLNDLFGGGFSDFFNQVFGGSAGGGRGRRAVRPSPEQDVTISLQEAYNGSHRRVEVNGRGLEVKIPAGAKTGTKMRMSGVGPGGGDVYLVLKVASDDRFKRKGNTLYAEVEVDLSTAVLGGEVSLTTLGGEVRLNVPPGTQPGQKIRLKGRGMPFLKSPDKHGDLLAEVKVTLPRTLTPRQRELFDELAQLEAQERKGL